jgi:uncharacterized protein
MSGAEVETVQSFLGKLVVGDLSGALGHLAPDVLIDEPAGLPYGGKHRGHEGFVALMQQMAEAVEFEVRGHELLDAGDTVVAKIDAEFTPRGGSASVGVPVVELYGVRDGLITSCDVYYKDPGAVANTIQRVAS